MGNAATCSLVDVVGTVTVTQIDGQTLQFVQPIFAWHVKKLHPGNWLVCYESGKDCTSGQRSKMYVLEDNEELLAGQIYVLISIPRFKKQMFGSSKQRIPSKAVGAAAYDSALSPPCPQLLPFILDGLAGRRQESNPVFSIANSSGSQQRPHRGHKFRVLDWRPTLVPIEEVL